MCDDVCHCKGKCAERGTSSRKGCRRSCRPADRFVVAFAQYVTRLEDSKNAVVVRFGDVQAGDHGHSKEALRALTCWFSSSVKRCIFEHCTSRCPSRDATMLVPTKKKKDSKRRLLLHEKDLSTAGAKVGGENFSQGRSFAADNESTSQQTKKQPPGPPAAFSA